MRCESEPVTMQHNQEPTELSTTETVVPERKPDIIYAEPESAVGELSPLRTLTKAKREKAFEQLPSAFIPPKHSNRTLILCFDGTGDKFDGDNSNVVQLCSLLKKDEPDKQRVYYQSGIGTVSPHKYITPLASTMSKALDQMVAYSLDTQVMEGYEFLMQSYTRGDRICIFGFSRGAYTARALAGMLHKIGLLPPNNHNQVPFAYQLYIDTTPHGWDQSNAFKRSFAIDVEIEFIGVWDTVNSVGIIPRRLPFTTSNTIVKTFRHALALDERRAKFQPNIWNRPTKAESKLGKEAEQRIPKTPPPTRNRSPSATLRTKISRLGIRPSNTAAPEPEPGKSESQDASAWFSIGKKGTKKNTDRWGTDEEEALLSKLERAYSERHTKPTDIKEVWFAGCHCDVGGGSVLNSTPHSLARIPLRWMIRECFLAETGIMFDTEGLKDIGMDPATLWPLVLPRPAPHKPSDFELPCETLPDTSLHRRFASLFSRGRRKYMTERLSADSDSEIEEALGSKHSHGALGEVKAGSEEVEELLDALSPVYDQLKLHKFWWLLECMPMEFTHQRNDDVWVSRTTFNRGRPREILNQEEQGVNVHRSVKMRMDARFCEDSDGNTIQKRYRPKAQFKVTPNWVD